MADFLDDLPDLGLKSSPKKPPEPIKQVPENIVVKYILPKCPKCGSKKIPVYDSSHWPIRYHKCTDCGFCFKSVEVTE